VTTYKDEVGCQIQKYQSRYMPLFYGQVDVIQESRPSRMCDKGRRRTRRESGKRMIGGGQKLSHFHIGDISGNLKLPDISPVLDCSGSGCPRKGLLK